MHLQVTSTAPSQIAADWLIVGVMANGVLDPVVADLDRELGGLITRLRETGDLTGAFAEMVEVRGLIGRAASRLLVVGWGDPARLTLSKIDQVWTTACRKLTSKKDIAVAVVLPGKLGEFSAISVVRSLAYSACVAGAGQGIYKSEADRHGLATLTICAGEAVSTELTAAATRGQILGEAANLTRELVNRHPGELYPETFARRAAGVASQLGLRCEVFDEHRLKQERMLSMLGVAQGSVHPARMVIIDYLGADPDAPKLALVGKGVTFDSGGLSLKPTEGMKTMKCDMAGAATVLGAMSAIARLKLPVNIIGYMGLVENMLSGTSYKLGEVLTARNGTTIEVLNTDAEGRLVLADVLAYAIDRGVDRIIDLATLTGACVIALGDDVTGLFSNNATWATEVLAAAREAGEDAWQLPMFENYGDQLKCDVADIKNVGTRAGGAITAAKFLERFVGETPWVHLDIAGPAFAESSKPHRDGGGTGVMVRTLVQAAETFGTKAG